MSQAYLSKLRLRAPADFQVVWKTGKRVSVQSLLIVSCKNSLGYPRLGISIPKKNVNAAVHRNRLKRLARETFRVRQHEFGGRDIVVLAQKGAEALAPDVQYQRFNALWDVFFQSLGKSA